LETAYLILHLHLDGVLNLSLWHGIRLQQSLAVWIGWNQMFSVRFADSLGFFAFCNCGLVLSYHEIAVIGGYGYILLLLEHALLLCQLLEKMFRHLMVNLNHMFSNPHDSGC
jgi:hypothetical protein